MLIPLTQMQAWIGALGICVNWSINYLNEYRFYFKEYLQTRR